MLTLPNFISLLRAPLALFFLSENIVLRSLALVLAMLSDGLDGNLARRHRMTTKFGTMLDPMMDKFFVFFVIAIFLGEGRLSLWEAAAFVCRDFSVILFGLYLVFTGNLMNYEFRAIWCGKLTTFFQFIVLALLTLGIAVPPVVFAIFIALGLMALIELALPKRALSNE